MTIASRHPGADATTRPDADEYAPQFAGYVARIEGGEDVLAVLEKQRRQVVARLERLPEARGDYRYAPAKWTIKEVIGHLSDTERVFAYRALRIGRADPTPLSSFDDQAYVAEMQAKGRRLADVMSEWSDVRRATLALFRNLPPQAWERRGRACEQAVSVRALAYVIAGHTRHHLETLADRYDV